MKQLSIRRRGQLTGFLFTLPWVLGFLAFTLYPIIDTARMSLHRVRIAGEGIVQTWEGIENYRRIFVMDVTFINALMQYLREVAVNVPLILVFSLLIAMLLNVPMRGRGFFRTVFFLPVIITSGPVLRYLMSQGALNLPGNAALQGFLRSSGLLDAGGLSTFSFMLQAFVGILWNAGLQILIFLAALQKIDPSMVEAARIDGANRWEIFWKLTLTHLNPMIVINTLFTIVMHSVFALNPIVDKIRVDLYLPDRGFGYASALAFIYLVVVLCVIGLAVLITRRKA